MAGILGIELRGVLMCSGDQTSHVHVPCLKDHLFHLSAVLSLAGYASQCALLATAQPGALLCFLVNGNLARCFLSR